MIIGVGLRVGRFLGGDSSYDPAGALRKYPSG
jgi:hypothetical protein